MIPERGWRGQLEGEGEEERSRARRLAWVAFNHETRSLTCDCCGSVGSSA